MSDLPANDEFISVNGSKFNRRLTDQFVKDIDIAHAINPNSWCIHSAGGAPFLAVGFLNAISIQGPSDGYSYLISTEGIDSHVSDLAKPYFDGKREYAERPWAQNLRLSDEAVAQNSDLFTEAHEAAIRRMAREVDSRANRWKRHVDSFRTSLNDALAIDIPEPGYLHDIPETVFPANLAQLVDEAAFTPDHFREFLEGVDSVMLDRLAEDIELAHGVNPNSWALGQFNPRELRLYVSRQIGFQLTPSQCSFVLSGRPDHPRLKILRPDISEERAAGSEEFIFENVVQDEANLLLDEFQEQHSMAIVSLAGNVKRQLPWARNHNQDLVEELGRVAGRELPQPKYLEAMGVAPDAPRPDAAANVTDIVDPSPEAAAQMARTILAAHALSSNCWAVYSTNKRIALMVGNIVAGGSAAPGKYDFVVLRSLLDGAVVAELDVVQVPKIPKQYETLSFPRLPDDTSDERFADLQTAHESALAVVTNPYQRAVVWQNHEEALRKRIEAISLIDLPEPGYVAKIPVKRRPTDGLSVLASLPTIRNQFAFTGLHYTDIQIATFYTSLQTKGFVVLSGISGTGKSKIATGFVEMLPAPAKSTEPSQSLEVVDDQIAFQVRPYMRQRHRVTFAKRYVDMFPEFTTSVGHKIPVVIGDQTGTGYLWYRVHNGQPEVTVRMHKSLYQAAEEWTLDKTMVADLDIDEETQEVMSVRFSCPAFDNLDTSDDTKQSNHLFLSVRPDWRDSTSLLGYYNPLTQTYEWTEFLHFLILAQESYKAKDGLAWFVILDEMNLAHVEYYFADLLSVIESGRDDEGWTREPLRLAYPDTLYDEVPPHELKLPPNLYIIGTVNMDETTHAFSPKVLDRAFTIELADVDFSTYPIAGAGSDAASLTDDQKSALLQAFTREGRIALIDKGEIGAVVTEHPRIREDLQALNSLLQPHRMHFGYRVFDEVCQYLHNNDLNGMMEFEDAFDQAVFMKVLPKFTGSRARLQSPLHGVLAWAIDPGKTSREDVSTVITGFNAFYAGTAVEAWTVQPAFPVVAARVRDMLVALERDGFVSFG